MVGGGLCPFSTRLTTRCPVQPQRTLGFKHILGASSISARDCCTCAFVERYCVNRAAICSGDGVLGGGQVPEGLLCIRTVVRRLRWGRHLLLKHEFGVGCFFFPSTVAHHTPLAQIETFSNDIPVVEKKKTKFNGQEQVSCVQSIHQGKTKQGKITFSSMQTLVGGHRDVFAV